MIGIGLNKCFTSGLVVLWQLLAEFYGYTSGTYILRFPDGSHHDQETEHSSGIGNWKKKAEVAFRIRMGTSSPCLGRLTCSANPRTR